MSEFKALATALGKAGYCLFFFWTCLFSQAHSQSAEAQDYVTYEFSGGRFGDNLMAYLHAKWISYRYDIPLLYKPFTYSSQLVLHDRELHYSKVDLAGFKEFPIFKKKALNLFSEELCNLYICPYFPEGVWERDNLRGPHGDPWFYFDTDWNDPDFRKLLQALVSPKERYQLIVPPKETINIAIHFRQGGTFDTGDCFLGFITKFPPLEFYIEGLLETIQLFPERPLYCYLFTDAANPSEFLEKIKQCVPLHVPITFDCREKNNAHNRNVLEDFFSLFKFDALIHSQSNFSVIPSLIHDYAVSYAPISGHLVENTVKIDNVKFAVNEELCLKLLYKEAPLPEFFPSDDCE